MRERLKWVGYFWPLRVPIIGAVVLLGLPWFAFWSGPRPYLSGLFDPIDDSALVLITALALFNGWALVLITGLILTYGAARLDLPELSIRFFPFRRRAWIVGAGLGGATVVRTMLYSHAASRHGFGGLLRYASVGSLVAICMLGLAIWIGRRLDSRNARARQRTEFSRAARWSQVFLRALANRPALGAGFVVETPAGQFALAPGHGLALGLASASVMLYIGIGFLTRNIDRSSLASALAYVLLLQLVLTWLIGFLTFVFDRGRIAIVVLLLIWIALVNTVLHHIWSTDHIYRTVKAAEAPALPAIDTLLVPDQPSILVAASGGGIHAAAWTARVLTGLQSLVGFNGHLRFISAVSGGSVGSLYAVAAMPDCGPVDQDAANAKKPFDPNHAAQASSLHAVGWGLVFKDLPRTIAPFFSAPDKDRGSVLEDAWKREPRLRHSNTEPLLASWRRNVAEHKCPALVFNAMAAESGDPLLFSTVALPKTLAAFDFYRRYPERDIPITTAVRLSAAFPYVSPAARADADDDVRGYTHAVDGGYFDNYGVSSLAAVVHGALAESGAALQGRRLLILEICDTDRCSGDAAPETPSLGGNDRGWPYQLIAPLSAVIAMRSAAQRATNRTTLGLLKNYWGVRGVCIESVPVPFSSGSPPMSWHMTQVEKDEIDRTWNRSSSAIVASVGAFLAGKPATAEAADCSAASRVAESK
jgi:hypothetical protein